MEKNINMDQQEHQLPFELLLENDKNFNQQGLDLLHKYYSDGKEGIQKALARPAITFSYGDDGLAKRIYEAVSKQWMFYSSPVLSNAPDGHWDKNETYDKEFWKDENKQRRLNAWKGSFPKALATSCFLTYAGDNIQSQIQAVSDISYLSVIGGGTALHARDVRATCEKAPGSITYSKVFDGVLGYYKQSKTRKGATAIYIDVSSPQIIEFIQLRKQTGGDKKRRIQNTTAIHHGINVTNKFLDAVEGNLDWELICPHSKEVKKVVKARYIWELILDTRILTGEPYLWNIDNANEYLPEAQKRLGLRNNGSNLCVGGETKVLIKTGNIEIRKLENQIVEAWNGEEWSQVQVFCTSQSAKLLKVVLVNSETGEETFIECTEYHYFYIKSNGKIVKTPALKLNVGDKLEEFVLPDAKNIKIKMEVKEIVDENKTEETFCFTEHLRNRGTFNGIVTGQCSEISLATNEERIAICTLASLNLEKYDEWKDTSLVADLTKFLDNVTQWFIDYAPPVLYRAIFSAKRERSLGIGGMGWAYFLMKNSIPYESGGFNSASQWNHIIWKDIKSKAKAATIQLAIDRGAAPDSIEGGDEVLVRNMHLLAPAPNANCQIGTNKVKIYDENKNIVDLSLYDILASQNIDVKKIEEANQQMWLYLKDKIHIPTYEGDDVVERIWYNGIQETIEIEFEDGSVYNYTKNHKLLVNRENVNVWIECKDLKEGDDIVKKPFALHVKITKIRVGKTLPTYDFEVKDKHHYLMENGVVSHNSSILSDSSSALEPLPSNAYPAKTRVGIHLVKNKYLIPILEKYGINDDATWKSIKKNNGSVQHLKQLSAHEKKVFKTAWEIDMHWVIEQAEQRQPEICQSQSLNLFFLPGSDKAYINSVHLKFLRSKTLKGLYYFRTLAKSKSESIDFTKSRKKLQSYNPSESSVCLGCEA